MLTKDKKIGDCVIILTKCLTTMQETILMTIQKDIHRISIQNNSQVVVNSINDKITDT